MKRIHRSAHRLIWVVLTPILIWLLWALVFAVLEPPANDILPVTVIEEASFDVS